MSEEGQAIDRGTGVKLDLTLNVPTLLALASMVAGAIVYINGQFTALNNQQLVTMGDVRVLQTQVQQQELAYQTLRNDTAVQITQFRSEYKQDMRELKQSVENLNMRNSINRGR